MTTSLLLNTFPQLSKSKVFDNAKEAVAYVHELYADSIQMLSDEFDNVAQDGTLSSEVIENATYPYIGMVVDASQLYRDPMLSHGVIYEPGIYGATLTRPDIFNDYFIEQIEYLMEHHGVDVVVGKSRVVIPLPFAVDHSPMALDPGKLGKIRDGFVLPDLSRLDDEVPNGEMESRHFQIRPLSMFSAERVDFSLNRLGHYTGTKPEHFQNFIILTNYQRYIDPFIEYARCCIAESDEYIGLTGSAGLSIDEQGNETPMKGDYLPQMPAYHLLRKDGNGITFINIGVGPSNAKTITDHLSVLRPHCWLMMGHCAGLRSTQVLGDYVLAHGYVREDNVLDDDLPVWVPVPPIAEVQVALQDAATKVSRVRPGQLKEHLRTGTVLTTDNRNWELRSKELYKRFNQSRAIAVDMESATIAANGFRFRVPYGTLLCVSDKPIHGEIKLQGVANEFYRQRVKEHLLVGLESINILRENGVGQLHSRKLRGFDEPPFR